MSEPKIKFGIHNAINEIISASSSLHMFPKRLPEGQIPETSQFLDETDMWCKHSSKHMRAAIQCLRKPKRLNRHIRRYVNLIVKINKSDKPDNYKNSMTILITNRIIDLFSYGYKRINK